MVSEARLVGGRYRLDAVIGRGAMGVVWRGYDTRLHRPVAVKEVHLTETATDEQRAGLTRRAMAEARHAANVVHPNIVAVHDVVADRGMPCLVMRLVEGRSLSQLVHADGPLRPEEAAEVGIALVDALAAAHRAGVVHRDVKPSNVLVTANGEILLTDFSIATNTIRGTLSAGSGALGSPGYIAPERLNGEATGPAADLFGLGATLFCAVEGFGPFDRADPLAALLATATTPHPQTQRAGPLADLIDQLLTKDPNDRPGLKETRRALAAIANQDPDGDAPTEVTAAMVPAALAGESETVQINPPRSAPNHRKKTNGRRNGLLIGAAALVCALAALAVVMIVGSSDPGQHGVTNAASLPVDGESSGDTPSATANPSDSASPSASASASASAAPTPSASASGSPRAGLAPSDDGAAGAADSDPQPVGSTTGATMSINRGTYIGSCAQAVALTVTLTVTVSEPTDVSYRLFISPDGSEVSSGAGATNDSTFSVSDQVSARFSSGTGNYSVQAVIESPTRFSPAAARINVICL